MGTEGSYKLLQTVGRKGPRELVGNKVGRGVDTTCPRCGEEEDTPDHIVFRCSKIERVKDKKGRGRREWVREVGVRWGSTSIEDG